MDTECVTIEIWGFGTNFLVIVDCMQQLYAMNALSAVLKGNTCDYEAAMLGSTHRLFSANNDHIVRLMAWLRLVAAGG